MTPTVSVIINTYNYGRFIEETIESALAQDYPADRMEIIVVDDGSTDDTPERAKKYEGRIRYFRTPNGDQCSAVTFGYRQAKGDLLVLLDGDDLWLPNKLSRVAEEFAKDPRIVMVYHKWIFWNPQDNTTWDDPLFAAVSGDLLADRSKLLVYIGAPTSSLAFRRNAFEPLTHIPLNRTFTYDGFLLAAALFLGPIACIPEALTRNRVHGKNRWNPGKRDFDPAKILHHVARRKATTEILRDWIRANAPKSTRPQARTVLRRARWIEDFNEFLVNPPNRFRWFQYSCRCALLEYPTSRLHLTYRLLHASAGLIIGERARYLEGIRTRVNTAARGLRAKRAASGGNDSRQGTVPTLPNR